MMVENPVPIVSFIFLCNYDYCILQSWGLGPRSYYDETGLRPVLVLVLVLQLWSWSQSWSYTFSLASNTVVPDKALCDTIMLKCNKHLYFSCNKYRNSAKRNWSSYHFLTFVAQSYFLLTNMRVAREEFFSVM